jgi:hypothetical protein
VTDSVKDYYVVVDSKSKSTNTLRSAVMRKHRRKDKSIVVKDKLSKKSDTRDGCCHSRKIRSRRLGIRMETSVTVAEPRGRVAANRGTYKCLPLRYSNKGL